MGQVCCLADDALPDNTTHMRRTKYYGDQYLRYKKKLNEEVNYLNIREDFIIFMHTDKVIECDILPCTYCSVAYIEKNIWNTKQDVVV
jgi:hypothetical protein